jgi:hypothetical protein
MTVSKASNLFGLWIRLVFPVYVVAISPIASSQVQFAFCDSKYVYVELEDSFEDYDLEILGQNNGEGRHESFMSGPLSQSQLKRLPSILVESIGETYSVYIPSVGAIVKSELVGYCPKPTGDGHKGFMGVLEGMPWECPTSRTPWRVAGIVVPCDASHAKTEQQSLLTWTSIDVETEPVGEVKPLSVAYKALRDERLSIAKAWESCLHLETLGASIYVLIAMEEKEGRLLLICVEDAKDATEPISFIGNNLPSVSPNILIFEDCDSETDFAMRNSVIHMLPSFDSSGEWRLLIVSDQIALVFEIVRRAEQANDASVQDSSNNGLALVVDELIYIGP